MANPQLGPGSDAGRTGTDTQSKAASAGHVIRTYTTTVLKQPAEADKIPAAVKTAAPNFVGHLQLAQAHATHYNDDIQPVMAHNVADLIAFSNTWKTFGPGLKKYADKADWPMVMQGLTIMKTSVGTYQQKAENTRQTLLGFQKLILGDARNFTSDYSLLTSTTKGLPAEIGALDKKIDAYNKQIDDFAAMIAGGAAAILVGGLMIVGGAMSEVLSFGATTAVVVGGVLAVGGGIALIVIGSKGIDKAGGEIADATARKARLNAELTTLKTYSTTVGSLQTAVGNAVDAVGNLAQAWEFIDQDMGNVIKALDQAKGTKQTPWFGPTLDAAIADWAQVQKMADAVQLQTANSKWVTVDIAKKPMTSALPAKAQKEVLSDVA